jgi:hypothetical protein
LFLFSSTYIHSEHKHDHGCSHDKKEEVKHDHQ